METTAQSEMLRGETINYNLIYNKITIFFRKL